ncbi:ketopantoate reductase family protein [Rothia sp. AR01]|uniref:2-dehydropantoate 2-reductase n=1 Tax=Rothia santali TaxID=2949643 RepID=A0A9X2KG52_9MICC|nr:ketopantoate reductase family protein [Rothia santali]MCP3424477.1 ketopantoate reductase family protein [Rothia santali]
MSIVVYGAGSLGLYLAARLAQAGEEVVLKVREMSGDHGRGETLRILTHEGIEDVTGVRNVESLAGVKADAAIVTTKAWQVGEAARDLAAALPPEAPVLTTQNGIDAPTSARGHLRDEQVLASTVVVIATRVAPLAVRLIGPDASLTVGSPSGRRASSARGLTDALSAAGLTMSWTDDITAALWKKLALICSYGGVGAIVDATVGETRADARTRRLVSQAMREVFAVAAAEGVRLTQEDLDDVSEVYLTGFAPGTTSSMHRDLLAGRPSELEDQVGAVVHRAERLCVPTPVLDTIYAAMAPREARARARR